MNEGQQAAAPKKTAAKVADEKKTITVTFEGDDVKLYNQITKDADADERTPATLLKIFLRRNYGGKTTTAVSE
jgi:hypothetical protein